MIDTGEKKLEARNYRVIWIQSWSYCAACAQSLKADTPQQPPWRCGLFYLLLLFVLALRGIISSWGEARAVTGLPTACLPSGPMRWSSVPGPALAPTSDGLNPGLCVPHQPSAANHGPSEEEGKGGRGILLISKVQSPARLSAGRKCDVSSGTGAHTPRKS